MWTSAAKNTVNLLFIPRVCRLFNGSWDSRFRQSRPVLLKVAIVINALWKTICLLETLLDRQQCDVFIPNIENVTGKWTFRSRLKWEIHSCQRVLFYLIRVVLWTECIPCRCPLIYCWLLTFLSREQRFWVSTGCIYIWWRLSVMCGLVLSVNVVC